ncbi:flavin reductase family protein [Kocuria oceani]|uniref:Flavin reductase family protein n=1 Tax=Kocuria oceani TaxID=988827 RepID=A0ABV9TPW9_9MICC|nr:flavin reductase family protein [Kocuria oceani]
MTFPSLHPTATTPDTTLFREAFRDHPAGLAVITATGADGPVGLTASSVSSVSADPPALMFSLSGATTAPVLAAADTVVVHLMDSEQIDVVHAFATPGADRFTEETDWVILPTGEPLLLNTVWALRCAVTDRVAVGASQVLIATVLDIRSAASAGDPLVYHDRTFHRLGQHSRIP